MIPLSLQAAAAYDLFDFHVMCAIVHGLNGTNIERLTTLLASITPSHKFTFEQLCSTAIPNKNFAVLRKMETDAFARGEKGAPTSALERAPSFTDSQSLTHAHSFTLASFHARSLSAHLPHLSHHLT
jgi:hypothetical protein